MAKFWACLLLVSWIHVSGETAPDVSEATLKTWISDILDQVDYLAEPTKQTPRLFAFGNRSFPILKGESELDTVIVAAELEYGRIIAVAENDFLDPAARPEYGCLETSYSKGVTYTGKLSHTEGNRPCQDWREQSPHKHKYTIKDFPDATMEEVANYCRNPNKHSRGLWCYTQDPEKRIEKCDLLSCTDTDKRQVRQFQKNAIFWLSWGMAFGGETVCYIHEIADLTCLDNPIVRVAIVYASGVLGTYEADEKMSQWVKYGGGLLYGLDQSSYSALPWSNALFYRVLTEAGIAYQNAKAQGVKPTKDVFPLDTAASVPDEIYVPYTTDATVSLLHSLSVPYAVRSLTEIAHLDFPTPLIATSIEMACSFDDVSHTMMTRRGIMSSFADFVHKKESELAWPPCDDDKAVYSEDVGEGIKHMFTMISCLGFLGLWNTKKSPNVDKCPGDLSDLNAPRLEGNVIVESLVPDFHPTQYYVPAGGELTVTVLSTYDPSWSTVYVYVGGHNDNLVKTPPFQRPPIISYKFSLSNITMRISSPWGGTVAFKTGKDATYLHAHLSGVVLAPYYKLGEDSPISWRRKMHYAAPWGVLSGHHMSFIFRSEHLRLIDDPGPILEEWDRVVIASYELAGVPQEKWFRESFIPDIELAKGLAHSGYPITALMDGYGDPTWDRWPLKLKNMHNTWGLYHEIGHNLAIKLWTFEGFTEVANNVFTLFNIEDAGRVDPLLANDGWYAKLFKKKHFVNLINSKDWEQTVSGSRNREMLMIYTQLYRQFGWGCYRRVFKSYEDDMALGNDLPESQQDRYDAWVFRWSRVTGYNLCPLFQFWSYPISICDTLTDLPAFLPTDDITEFDDVKARADEVAAKYPGILRSQPRKPPCYTPTAAHKRQLIDKLTSFNLVGQRRSYFEAIYNPPAHKWHKMSKLYSGFR